MQSKKRVLHRNHLGQFISNQDVGDLKKPSKKCIRRIMYLRNETGSPVGCLAISVNRTRKRLRYQLSVLNPVDRFDREHARLYALGRLLEKPIQLQMEGNENGFDITTRVMADIWKCSDVPSRARKAARNWLRQNVFVDEVDLEEVEE